MKTHKLSFSSKQLRQDPWTAFDYYRLQGPVIRFKIPLLGTGWAATTYDAVSQVLKDDQRFVRDPKNAGRKSFGMIQYMLPRSFFAVMHNMLGADGEKHRRLRTVVDQAFARRNVDSMKERIEVLAREQLTVAEQAAASTGQFDLIQHFARPFPLTVICELLGLPMGDRQKFQSWFSPFSTVKNIFGMWKLGKGVRNISTYLRELFDEVRKTPRSGLISELVRIEHDGSRLNEQELLSMVFLLLVAGHETTVHLISNAVFTLLQQPAALQELLNEWQSESDHQDSARGEQSISEAAIDEVLRFASPLQLAKARYAVEDMEFFGQQLKRGEMMTPLLAAANYDPDRFDHPRQFDLRRERNYHMSFGSGPHVCLGMKLARSETTAALRALFTHWPDLRLAFDPTEPDWGSRPGTRGFNSMLLQV